MGKLFREEVYAKKTSQWLGSVRLARPLSFSMMACAALVVLGLVVAFMLLGEITRKARLSGVLLAAGGSSSISSPQSGSVLERRVREGQRVEKGQVLFVIDTERQTFINQQVAGNAGAAEAQILMRSQNLDEERLLKQSHALQRDQNLGDQIRTIDAEIRKLAEEVALQARRVQLAQNSLERYQKLAAGSFVSEVQLQTKQEDLLDAKAKAESLLRSQLALVHDQQAVKNEKANLQMQVKEDASQMDRSRSSLLQEQAEAQARKTVVLTAPISGVVAAENLELGQSVQPGQILATILPSQNGETKLQASLYAPSRTVGFIQAGQVVRIRYAAYPYQKFGLYEGKIVGISAMPFAPNELPANLSQQIIAQVGSTEALYRVDVELLKQSIEANGQNYPLKPGLTLEADVVQETRKLWELFFEPLLAGSRNL